MRIRHRALGGSGSSASVFGQSEVELQSVAAVQQAPVSWSPQAVRYDEDWFLWRQAAPGEEATLRDGSAHLADGVLASEPDLRCGVDRYSQVLMSGRPSHSSTVGRRWLPLQQYRVSLR